MKNCELLVKGIVKCQEKYLIIAKWYDDCISEPYQWQFIDGGVEHGESPDAAVCRLIEEQTGLSAEINRILYTWSFMLGDIHKVGIAYECLASDDTVMLEEELNDFKWVTREEFETYIANEHVLADLERAEF